VPVAEAEVVLAVAHLQPRTSFVVRLGDAASDLWAGRRLERQRRGRLDRHHRGALVEDAGDTAERKRGDRGPGDVALAALETGDPLEDLQVRDGAESRRGRTLETAVDQLELTEEVVGVRCRAVLVLVGEAEHA